MPNATVLATSLLLPALAGFLFIQISYLHRFRAHQLSGQRLVFEVLQKAVIFWLGAVLMNRLAELNAPVLHAIILAGWNYLLPPASGSAVLTSIGVLAMILAVLTALMWNVGVLMLQSDHKALTSDRDDGLRYRMKKAAIVSHVEGSDEPHLRAVFRADELKKPLQVTLKSGKVYIGTPGGAVDPVDGRRWLKLLPIFSGYRRPEEKTIQITTEFVAIHRQLIENARSVHGPTGSILDSNQTIVLTSPLDEQEIAVPTLDFGVLLPWAEIESVSIWDPDVYAYFNARSSRVPPYQPWQTPL